MNKYQFYSILVPAVQRMLAAGFVIDLKVLPGKTYRFYPMMQQDTRDFLFDEAYQVHQSKVGSYFSLNVLDVE